MLADCFVVMINGDDHGMTFDIEGADLKVKSIAERGQATLWNVANPEKKIQIGDCVVEVDGTQGSPGELIISLFALESSYQHMLKIRRKATAFSPDEWEEWRAPEPPNASYAMQLESSAGGHRNIDLQREISQPALLPPGMQSLIQQSRNSRSRSRERLSRPRVDAAARLSAKPMARPKDSATRLSPSIDIAGAVARLSAQSMARPYVQPGLSAQSMARPYVQPGASVLETNTRQAMSHNETPREAAMSYGVPAWLENSSGDPLEQLSKLGTQGKIAKISWVSWFPPRVEIHADVHGNLRTFTGESKDSSTKKAKQEAARSALNALRRAFRNQ